MSAGLAPHDARRIVEARLGREPQDALETAVVLEAWSGVPAQEALRLGAAVMRAGAPSPLPSAGAPAEARPEERLAVEAIAFVVAVVAIACWSGPLADAATAHIVGRALTLALPLTLGVQWALRSRYLGRPEGLELLAGRRHMVALAGVGLVAVPAAVLGTSGVLAGLLTLTWTGGTVLVRRGWAALYAVAVTAATAAMLADLRADAVLLVLTDVVLVGVAMALPRRASAVVPPPGRAGRAVLAGTIGAALGGLMVSDGSIDWALGTGPALALLPSTVASFWAGYHLWSLQHAIPRALAGIPAITGAPGGAAWPAMRVLLGAVVRLVSLTAILSLGVALAASRVGAEHLSAGILVAFGAVALATLVVSLLEAVGRGVWGLGAASLGVAAELTVRLTDLVAFAAGPLLVGASVTVALGLVAAIVLLIRPATMLATTLYVR